MRKPATTKASHETHQPVRLGFVPLLDAAPLLLARQMEFFERQGLRVILQPELGWASIREKLLYGELEAAHAPAVMALSMQLGLQSRACPVVADLILSRQGNAITLSKELWQKGVRDGRSFSLAVRSEVPRRFVFAVVSIFSSHHFLVRQWLVRHGVNPETDIRFVVLPPNLMCEHLREGNIDGYCAGEPWNSTAVLSGDGWIVADSEEIAPRHPEKALVARADFSISRPEACQGLRRALAEACQWCDAPGHRPVVAQALEASGYFDLPLKVLANSLTGTMDRGAGRSRKADGFIRYSDGSPLQADEWSCRQILDQARSLGLPALPAQLNITLARKLFLPAVRGRERQPQRMEIPS